MFDISRTLQRLKGAAELFPAKTHRYSYGIASEFHRAMEKKRQREREANKFVKCYDFPFVIA